ncbi:MAG: hypothetical protein U9R05_05450 [Chloroflexota bacterium]|nr:hypothetical protein [Chloroflexota bacterium]
MQRQIFRVLGWGGLVLGAILVLWGWSGRATSAPAQLPTPTPEPIVPTATLVAQLPTTEPVISTEAPTILMTAEPSPPVPTVEDPFVLPPEERFRLGISVPARSPQDYDLAALGVGWVMNWNAYAAPPVPPGVDFAQTVRVKDGVLTPDAAELTAVAAANPGALWLIGNEPDVRWQDNVTPETYARLYHEAYSAIRAGDAGANVAPGGIAQPTPLRLRYLERVLAAYQAEFGEQLPAQVWHIHNYMLREERDSWGVDIPPGFTDDTGALYTVDDSGNLELFQAQLYTFRRWMAAQGYRDLPLVVSEFGIPMPEEYGFPPERVATYLRETWRFFATATDPALGNPHDGGRLVQRWCWFSMAFQPYPTGDLVDLETGAWTPLGRAWLALVGTR